MKAVLKLVRNLGGPVRPDAGGDAVAAPATAAPQRAVAEAIRRLAAEAGGLGREAAELNGTVQDVAAVAHRQAAAFDALSAEIDTMTGDNTLIAQAIGTSEASAREARATVERVAADVAGASDSLREVASVAGDITRIALQTRLVAFNASVEAKRAGEAGRGFSVVADAVKELAGQVEVSSKAIAATLQQLDQRIGELARNIRAAETADGSATFSSAFSRVEAAIADIGRSLARHEQSCTTTRGSLATLSAEVAGTTRALDGAARRTDQLLSACERVIGLTVGCGAETADTPMIGRVQAAAAQIAAAFERAIDAGEISVDDLFDEDYRPIAGTAPPQHGTRFVALTDRLLPPIQEAMLALDERIVFCAAVDRNGYLPTHNRRFSQPQGRDPVWNAAHSRNRRIFDDRTGLAAGRNRQPFLLQTYRRDLGGGQYRLMKDLSAPIEVRGRHWGGLRLAYGF